jgi:hypothetical protein
MITSVGSSCNGCVTIGILQPSQHDMPRDKSELEAESWQNLPNCRTGFYIVGCATVQIIALRGAVLKGKKVSYCLGIIYHSMVLSQPPSHDTVSLKGQSHEIFDLRFFSCIHPTWVTDQRVKIFLHMVANSLRNLRIWVVSALSRIARSRNSPLCSIAQSCDSTLSGITRSRNSPLCGIARSRR